ncbi:rhodanese-like domain-containing protein [Methanolobus sp. ZRKC3]|uniref:rhodanese-like domain-containing protein n=1 Tax=Methanolobus sp. ZRKC3 TaxID=3125786 RepID=UPI0032556A85
MEEDEYESFVSKDQFGFYDISAEGAKKMVDKKDAFVLDVRDQAAFDKEHLEDAHRIDVLDIENKVDELPQDKKILVYCEIGVLSMAAGKKLLESGFSEVYNITGGFQEWKQAGYPTEK